MINEHRAKKYCRDDISKIENYDKAVADPTQKWVCHHRLELTLDGEFAHTPEELQRLGVYFNRPYFELIFLTRSEHQRMHRKDKALSEECRQKISKANKGQHRSDETKRKMSASHTGKSFTDEHRRKMSEASRKYWARRRAEKS